MRTTLNIDDDVLDRAKAVTAQLKSPFKRVVNEALREGLKTFEQPARAKPYRTCPGKLGLKPGRNLDNIQELLAQVDGENYR